MDVGRQGNCLVAHVPKQSLPTAASTIGPQVDKKVDTLVIQISNTKLHQAPCKRP
jgi:hypothetical protein